MKIKTYKELRSKNELLPLLDQAIGWPFNPVEFEKAIRADARLQHGPVGYAAIENNHLAGFVGVTELPTRTLDGAEEIVGGIWGVATHPAYARRGISTALMRRSHEYFKERNYRLSLLVTARPIVAYEFYQKLGYMEAVVFPSAYKLVIRPRIPARKSTKKTKLDWNRILKIYSQATEDRTGLIVRDKEYERMLETRKRIQPEKCVVTDEGYALLKDEEGNMAVQEIIALTTEETSKLINLIEEKTTKAVIDEVVLSNRLLHIYQSRGYMVLKDSYNVLMAKPLSKMSFTEVYGDKFYMTSADLF